jgi:sRNA-binding carbon storage regulator CsrA
MAAIAHMGNQLRLGTTAAKDVPAHREEIYKRIQRQENASARFNQCEAL